MLAISGAVLCFGSITARAAEPGRQAITVITNLPYKSGGSLTALESEFCRLDLYLPTEGNRAPVLLWFHGGALEIGTKDEEFTRNIARSLAQSGIAVAAANYRLSPKSRFPAYLQDASAAFAWVRLNIAAHGGDTNRLFIAGHSAGGYLTYMLGLDPCWLQEAGLDSSAIAGLIPISGQTLTHSTIRAERGLHRTTLIADDAAPVHHARTNTPPLLVLYAENDYPLYVEQNQLLVAALRTVGHPSVTARLVPDRDHISIAANITNSTDPVHRAMVEFMNGSLPPRP